MSAVLRQNAAITLTGDFETANALLKFEKKVERKVIKKALRASANMVRKIARARARKKTGKLRQSIKARVLRKGPKGNKLPRNVYGMMVISGLPGKKMNTGDAFYGAFIEQGTKQRETKAGKNRGKIVKDPWLAPSLIKNRRKVQLEFQRALKQAVAEMPPPKRVTPKFKSGI